MGSSFFSFDGSNRSSTIFFLVVIGLIVPVLGACFYHYRRTNSAILRPLLITTGTQVNKPKLWDVWVKMADADVWDNGDVLPLSAHVDNNDFGAENHAHQNHYHVSSASSTMQGPTTTTTTRSQRQVVDVNVLILMPSSLRRVGAKLVTDNFDELGGYWIGTTKFLASPQLGSE